jgi:hypothetical protein
MLRKNTPTKTKYKDLFPSHVTSSRRSCEDEVKDRWIDATGCIGPFYPNFSIFIVLGPRGILVFWLGL